MDGCKLVYVARFHPDLAHDVAAELWTHRHGPMADDLPDLHTYVQSHAVAGLGATGVPGERGVAFDGYACEWWTSPEAFAAGMRTPAWERIVQDGEEIFDGASLERMSASVEERVMRDGPASPFKVVWFVRFRRDLPREEISAHWRDVHGRIALRAPGIDRYVQNLVTGAVGHAGVTDGEVAFDGFSECWYADEDAYLRSIASAAWAELIADEPNFMEPLGIPGMTAVLEERVIKAGAAHG